MSQIGTTWIPFLKGTDPAVSHDQVAEALSSMVIETGVRVISVETVYHPSWHGLSQVPVGVRVWHERQDAVSSPTKVVSPSMSPGKTDALLDLEWDFPEREFTTIRGYLCALLAKVWNDKNDFDYNRAFGYTHWERDLLPPLIAAGAIADVPVDHPSRADALLEQQAKLYDVIASLIPAMANSPLANRSS